jgi:hypothetical protein
VPDSLIGETLVELRKRFRAASFDPRPIQGHWGHEGQVYYDELVRIFIDTEDAAENRQFFVKFKERLKTRFQQLDIWISKHPIELL